MTHNQIREENETSQVFVTKAQVRAVDKMAILIFFFFFFFFFFSIFYVKTLWVLITSALTRHF